MKKYIAYKPFKIFKGGVLPVGNEVDCSEDGKVYYEGYFICLVHSVHSQECFVGNDDGCGMERGKLIEDIESLVQGEPDLDLRCDRVTALWEDDTAKKYVRYNDPSGPWLWDDSYFCADIDDLEHIKDIIINAPHYKEGSEENVDN